MSFLRASGVVLGGQGIAAVLGILSLVLATRMLSVGLFAELQVFIAAAVAIGNVLAFGSPWVLVRISSIARRSKADLDRAVYYMVGLLAACVATAVGIGLVLGASLHSSWLPGDWSGLRYSSTLVVVAGVMLAFGGATSAVLRGLERYVLLQTTAVAARLALIVAIVGAALVDPFAVYVSGLAVVELSSLALVVLLLVGVSKELCGGAGAPSGSATLAAGSLLRETGAYYGVTFSSMFRADLLVLAVAALAALTEAAHLRLAMQTLAVFHLGIAVIGTPYLPQAADLLAGDRGSARFANFFDAVSRLEMAVLLPPLVFFCWLAGDLFALVYGEAYRGASAPAVILAAAVGVRLLLGPINNTLIALRAAKSALFAELAALTGVVAVVTAAAAGADAVHAALAVLAGAVAWHVVGWAALRRRLPRLHARPLFVPRLALALACSGGAVAASFVATLASESTLARAGAFGLLYALWGGWVLRRVRGGVLGGAVRRGGGS